MNRYRFNGTSYDLSGEQYDYDLSNVEDNGDISFPSSSNPQNDSKLDDYNDEVTQLDSLETIALDEYKEYYVKSNLNPEDTTYSDSLDAAKNKIDEQHAGMFVLSNNIQIDLSDINDSVREIEEELASERVKNRDLKRHYNRLLGKDNSSFVMIDDAFEIYKYQYITNWAMFTGISTLLYVFYKSFNQKVG